MNFILCVLLATSWPVPQPKDTDYPDPEGFKQRADLIIRGLASNDLGVWRRGYFSAGDPGKYLPASAMAKLLLNPDDPEPRKYMNDDRSYKEHYHFAALNWARFLPIFNDALTDDTKQKLAETVAKYAYFNQGGTENHKVMWLTAANVTPSYIAGNRFSMMSVDEALARAKEDLRRYVKGLYAAGQGEWDSSTYLMFDLHGMLNIYDFAKDPETRLIARAALDWYTAGYALKYTDGYYCAPNQRGFASEPVGSIADQTGWLWWGCRATLTTNETRRFHYAIHAATSGWRPNKILCNLAQKKLPNLPVEQRNTKPNYWFGQNKPPQAGQYHETVYLDRDLTIGTLWNGHGSQITRFQIIADGKMFTGGNPRRSDHTGKKTDLGFADGNGRYTQFAAHGPTVICLSRVPADDTDAAFSFFSLPADVEPKPDGDWWQIGRLHLYPIGGKAEVFTSEPDKKGQRLRYLKIPGHSSGFVVTAGNPMPVRVTGDEVQAGDLTLKFNPAPDGDNHGDRLPHVTIAGQPVEPGNWKIYGGPFVTQTPGVLTVSDGRDRFTVEFTGDLPEYR